jgi:hypothetical protein
VHIARRGQALDGWNKGHLPSNCFTRPEGDVSLGRENAGGELKQNEILIKVSYHIRKVMIPDA